MNWMCTSFLLGYFENCFVHFAKFKVEIFDNLGKHDAVDNNSALLCSAPESPKLSVAISTITSARNTGGQFCTYTLLAFRLKSLNLASAIPKVFFLLQSITSPVSVPRKLVPKKRFFMPSPNQILRIQFKLNTALLSYCPCDRVFVTGVTSHISHIYKGINAMLIIKPYIF